MTQTPLAARLQILPLSPARQADFLAFFEGDAFADNPKWSFCYCQCMHVDHRVVDWRNRSATENREAACSRISQERMQGYLAYRDGKVVGWCNAAPRTLLDAFLAEPDPDAERIGQISCFVVAPAHRRTGVARALLNAACHGLREQGLQIAEGCPNANAANDAQHHCGPLSLFLQAGFTPHRREDDGTVWVRRNLLDWPGQPIAQAYSPPTQA